jgi:heme A synthase
MANIVGGMLFIQVILGGSATLLSFPIGYHIVWGVVTFIVLLVTTGLIFREFGRRSSLFIVSILTIVDFIIQGALGFLAFSSDVVVLIHLTNAFVLAVFISNLIAIADRGVPAKAVVDKTVPKAT